MRTIGPFSKSGWMRRVGALALWGMLAAPDALAQSYTNVSQLIAGYRHTCAIDAGGSMRCWGNNSFGQLGLGTTTSQNTPQAVSGLVGAATQPAAGENHTCVIEAGTPKCWGRNDVGQLGLGNTTQQTTPQAVTGLTTPVTQLAAGGLHTCALETGGTAKCWGWNLYGQLGRGIVSTSESTPRAVLDVAGATQLVGGFTHNCVLLPGGTVRCWGSNSNGQLGIGNTVEQYRPALVSGFSGAVTQLAAGFYHTCALESGGTVKCWGFNGTGQLGLGDTNSRLTPQAVPGLGTVTSIAAGSQSTCAIESGGTVKCWGNNFSGELGVGDNTERRTPTVVTGFSGTVTRVVGGEVHGCALESPGTVKCWGRNVEGQLGIGTALPTVRPTQVVCPTCPAGAARLAVTTISPASPTLGATFSVTVESRDSAGVASNVTASTLVSLSLQSGTGTLSGTASCTIAAASNRCTAINLGYNKAETGVVLRATASGGILAAGDSAPFSVVAACDTGVGSGDCDGDGIPNGVEAAEGRNPSVKDNDIFSNARLFAMQQYRDFLGREGDTGGITFNANQVTSGAASRAQLTEGFFNSAEFQNSVAPITRLYLGTYRRIPDTGGLLFWIGEYRKDPTPANLQRISTVFATAPEFVSSYGTLDNTAFVNKLYELILGRAADTAGVNFWVGQLAGGTSRGVMLSQFTESAEYQQKTANDVYVIAIFVGMLRRAPDQGGFDFWKGQLAGGTPRLNLINAFLAAPEYRARFLP